MDNGSENYRRFLEGDEAGLAAVIREYKDGLILYLKGFTGDFHAAEDLAEETFLRLLIKGPKDQGKASFKTWLYTIGRNVALNDRRKRRPDVGLPEDSAYGTELEEAYLQEEEKRLLYRALRSLNPDYQQILWLVYFEGFSDREAAAVMKRSVHATETLVYRARNALRSALEKEGFTHENDR